LTVELTDELVDSIKPNIRTSPEFKQFHDFERSGKYLICRRQPHSEANADFLFDTQGMDKFSRMVYFRNQFSPGDVRIKFEFVQQPYVMVLAQQVQTSDDVFRLRPWNPFSAQHEVAVDDEESGFDRKVNEKRNSSSSPCCAFADFLLQNLCEDSIEVIENCRTSEKEADIAYLHEAKYNMHYAKWFRPILGISLTVLLLVAISMADEFNMISYFKALYQSQGVPPERLDIVFSLTIMTGSKTIALAIDALIAAIGLYLLISSVAWWYPTFSWISFLCFLQGAISIVAAIFWLCV